MKHYLCQILTPIFFEKAKALVEELASKTGESIDMLWTELLYDWSIPSQGDLASKLGLSNPEYIEEEFVPMEEGWDEPPKIVWQGKVCIMADIPQIIGYRPVIPGVRQVLAGLQVELS